MLATPQSAGVASTSTWKEPVLVANFKQIIAMCLDGASYAQITHALGCSRREVSRAKKVINDEELTPERFRQLPPGWFDDRFSDGRSKRSLPYDQPDFHALARKLKGTKHVTRHKLWMDYVSQPCPTDKTKYQYSQFCSGLNEFLRANDLVEVITHEPGQELYVDWAGDKVPVTDQASGDTVFKASLFVAVSPYSGLMYVTAAANEKMPAWIECHVKALNYLGKVPAIIVPDNASTATYRPKKTSTYRIVTDRYAAFADYYGVTIVPTRPGRPRDKAAVERAVKIAYTKILGYFSNEVFYSLVELNEAIAERLVDINGAMTRPDGSTRQMRFDKEEAPMMRDLPPTPFTEVSYKRLKVDRNWHITCDYQYYSVPFQLVEESVTVRLTPQLVSVFNGEQLVAEHTRLHGFKYRYSTNPQHGPRGDDEGHKALTRDELLAWASSFGAATHAVIAMILDRNSAAVPRGLIQARNVLANLGKKHNKATLEPACQQVVDKKLAPTMAVIKRIQTDIAHAQQHPWAPGPKTQPVSKRQPRPSTPLTGDVADAVFIRPADHYEN